MHDDDADFQFDPALVAIHPRIKEAIAYWESKRGDRIAPARADLEPREMKSFLPQLQIFDVLDGGKAYRPRLIGTAIAAQVNENATGVVFDES